MLWVLDIKICQQFVLKYSNIQWIHKSTNLSIAGHNYYYLFISTIDYSKNFTTSYLLTIGHMPMFVVKLVVNFLMVCVMDLWIPWLVVSEWPTDDSQVPDDHLWNAATPEAQLRQPHPPHDDRVPDSPGNPERGRGGAPHRYEGPGAVLLHQSRPAHHIYSTLYAGMAARLDGKFKSDWFLMKTFFFVSLKGLKL